MAGAILPAITHGFAGKCEATPGLIDDENSEIIALWEQVFGDPVEMERKHMAKQDMPVYKFGLKTAWKANPETKIMQPEAAQ